MSLLAPALIAVVALIHLYIVLLEMVWWTGPRGRKAFNLTPEFASSTKALAANQGLYNGFLVAGLVWGLFYPDPAFAWQIQMFFLGCVAIAGLYGAVTIGRKPLLIQTVPAVLAMLAVTLA